MPDSSILACAYTNVEQGHLKASFFAFFDGIKDIFVDTPAYLPKAFMLCARFVIFGIILLLCILTIEMVKNSLRRKLRFGFAQGATCAFIIMALLAIYSPREVSIPVKTPANSANITYLDQTKPIGKDMREKIIIELCKQKASLRLKPKPKFKGKHKAITINYDYLDVSIETDGEKTYYYMDTEKDFLYEIIDENNTFKKYLAELA